jgi:hypothetical protein
MRQYRGGGIRRALGGVGPGGIVDTQEVDAKIDPQRAAIGHERGVALVDGLDHEGAEDKARAIEQRQRLALIGHGAQLVERGAAIGDLGIDRPGQADLLVPRPEELDRIARAHPRRAGKAPVGLALQFVVGERGDLEEEQAKGHQVHRVVSLSIGKGAPAPLALDILDGLAHRLRDVRRARRACVDGDRVAGRGGRHGPCPRRALRRDGRRQRA